MLIQAEPVTVTIPPTDIVVPTPNFDVVRVWEAPIDGAISIQNSITNNDATKEVTHDFLLSFLQFP